MDFTLEAVAPVPVLNRNGQFQTVEFVVDTGFDGFLALPAELIQRLGLEPYSSSEVTFSSSEVTFANGQRELCNTWHCRIRWHDQPRDIVIFESRGEVLLGMALLEGSQITIQARVDGAVVIEELS